MMAVLFAEDPVGRKAVADQLAHAFLGLSVGHRNRRLVRLAVDRVVGAEVAANDCTRFRLPAGV